MSETATVARLVAKLLAQRRTPLEEVPKIISEVRRALANLGEAAPEIPAAPKPQRARAQTIRALRQALPAVAPVEPTAKPPQPTLVRRAEVISVAPVAPPSAFAPPPSGTVRGVVQWFDSRTGQGMLRLAGLSRDLPVDAAQLGALGIQRLFKGQEIEATLEEFGDAPKIAALHVTNAPAATPLVSGGIVRDRHAKAVVVELKRETQRRSAARAEAELLLPPQRAR